MLLLSPFLVVFMLVYLFLRHAEQFYNHPSTASSRRWSNLSKWIFREFNEVIFFPCFVYLLWQFFSLLLMFFFIWNLMFFKVDHLFKHRINSSVTHASDYLKQFPSPILSIVAKFVSFVSGGFAAILIIIAFLEESLLEGHVMFFLIMIKVKLICFDWSCSCFVCRSLGVICSGMELFLELSLLLVELLFQMSFLYLIHMALCLLLSNILIICLKDGVEKKTPNMFEWSLKLFSR